MSVSRRELLRLGAGACAAWTAGLRLPSAQAALGRLRRARQGVAYKVPIGLQLYSVRQQCEKDLPGVLAEVAKMGYRGVEFAGYYNRTAPDLRKLLDANNLQCCGTHISLDALLGDELKKTVEFNKVLGNPYLVVSWLPPERTKTAEAIKNTAKLFAEAGQKVKNEGMRVGYHAHPGDFKKPEGSTDTEWDLFFTNAGPDVVMQMDVGNCLEGGGDPYASLRKFPGRSATIHIKEHGGKPGAPIGEGTVKWSELFDLCETTGNTRWYIVEHESDPKTPMESVKKCIDGLRKMGKV
jgi:sugar phosphate isomerase/epimerase